MLDASQARGPTPPLTFAPFEGAALDALLGQMRWREALSLCLESIETTDFGLDADLLSKAAWIALSKLNDAETALTLLTKAESQDPESAEVLFRLASAHETIGDRDAAVAVYYRLLDIEPGHAGALYQLAMKRGDDGVALGRAVDQAIAALDAQPDAHAPIDKAHLYGALGLLGEGQHRFDEAFDAFTTSNLALNPQYLPALHACQLNLRRQAFTAAAMGKRWAEGSDDATMVFVVGLPRSGSSLVEQILAAHPDVVGLGERREMPTVLGQAFPFADGVPLEQACYASLRAAFDASPEQRRRIGAFYVSRMRDAAAQTASQPPRRLVDKLPGNIMSCGVISMLLPQARFIITDRDPRDVAASCYRTCFGEAMGFTERLDWFAHQYMIQRELARLWRDVLGDRVIEVRYEDVVADVEGQAKRLVSHIGLEWAPACAKPHLTGSAVSTASRLQVRAPVNDRSVGTWRRYEKQFAELDQNIRGYEAAAARGPVTIQS